MNFYSIQIVYKMKNLLKTPAFCTIIFLVSNIHNIKKDFLSNVGGFGLFQCTKGNSDDLEKNHQNYKTVIKKEYKCYNMRITALAEPLVVHEATATIDLVLERC